MDLAIKLAIYFIIIASEVDYLFSRPMNNSLRRVKERKRRQVVQPTWLTRPDLLFVDPNVHVTKENLKETADIRQSIQSAVDAGTFAVDVSQPNVPIPVVENSENTPRPRPIFGDISQWNFQIFNIDQQNAFTEEMRRVWQEFVDNSRKWFNFNPQL